MDNKAQNGLNMRQIMYRHMFLLQLTWEPTQFSIEGLSRSNSGCNRTRVMEMALGGGGWGGTGTGGDSEV